MRKVVRAARTESDLEGDRLQGALAEELQAAKRVAGGQRPALAAVPDPAAVRASSRAAQLDPPRPPDSSAQQAAPAWLAPPVSVAPPAPVRAPLPPPTPGEPLAGTDVREADPEHLPLISALVLEREAQLRAQHPGAQGRSIDVLWVRSNATHAVWLERRRAGSAAARPREVICVAQIDRGRVGERWFFG